MARVLRLSSAVMGAGQIFARNVTVRCRDGIEVSRWLKDRRSVRHRTSVFSVLYLIADIVIGTLAGARILSPGRLVRRPISAVASGSFWT